MHPHSMVKSLFAGAVLATLLAACAQGSGRHAGSSRVTAQAELGGRAKPLVIVDGLRFRDLDGDGSLTPYEDRRKGDDSAAIYDYAVIRVEGVG